MQRLEETEDVILRRENKNSDKDGKGNGNVESEDRKRGDLTGKIIKTERKDSQDRFL